MNKILALIYILIITFFGSSIFAQEIIPEHSESIISLDSEKSTDTFEDMLEKALEEMAATANERKKKFNNREIRVYKSLLGRQKLKENSKFGSSFEDTFPELSGKKLADFYPGTISPGAGEYIFIKSVLDEHQLELHKLSCGGKDITPNEGSHYIYELYCVIDTTNALYLGDEENYFEIIGEIDQTLALKVAQLAFDRKNNEEHRQTRKLTAIEFSDGKYKLHYAGILCTETLGFKIIEDKGTLLLEYDSFIQSRCA